MNSSPRKDLRSLPTIVANAESLRRDSAGLIDESSLTPRSVVLRDRIVHGLRSELIRQHYPGRPPEQRPPWNLAHGEVAKIDPLFDNVSLPHVSAIFEQHKGSKEAEGNENKKRSAHKKPPETTQEGEDNLLLVTCFHKVLIMLLSDSNCWYRLVAVEALNQPKIQEIAIGSGTELSLTFAESLKDSFPLVRRFAVEGIGAIGHTTVETCRELRRVALDDVDRRVRADAAKVLARMGVNGIMELARCLQESDFWPVRSQAALALGTVPVTTRSDLVSAPLAEAGGENDTESLMEEIDSTIALKILKMTLTLDKVPGVRESAAEALGCLGKYALPAVETLIKHAKDQDLRVRIAVVTALGKVVSEAAPYYCELAHHDLMQRGNPLDDEPKFCDTLRLTCRVLTGVVRDREPLLKNAEGLYELENQKLDGFLTPDRSARRLELRNKERQKLFEEGGHVQGLFCAGEESLRAIGAYAWPSIVARLIEEDNLGLSFASRMAILRALHCSASSFATDELVNSMLSEWVATPDLTKGHYLMNMKAVANTLPVSGARLISIQHIEEKSISWAFLLDRAANELIVLFSLQAGGGSADLLETDNGEVIQAELSDGSRLPVHSGLWNFVDSIWAALLQTLCEEMEDHFDTRSDRRLRLCGSSLGGAIAQVVAIKLHCEEVSQVGTEGLTVLSFGAPNIVAMADGEMPALSAVSSRSRCWTLLGDPLPCLLGANRPKVMKHFRTRSILLCGRRRYSLRQGSVLHNSVTSGATMPPHSWGSLFPSEQAKPVMRERPQTRQGMENSFDETLNDPKSYTNALCWRQLESIMPYKT